MKALDVSVQTISHWENDVNYLDIAKIPKIASFFHVTTDKLWEEKENVMSTNT